MTAAANGLVFRRVTRWHLGEIEGGGDVLCLLIR